MTYPRPRPPLIAALCAGSLAACEPTVVAGEWTCPSGDPDVDFGEVVPNPDEPVKTGWSTGFEREFCDYARLHGFCYADPGASFSIVASPTHSGKSAAAFRVTGDAQGGHQARCVRQGRLPTAAYYSAWYFVPSRAVNTGNWNIFHFDSPDSSGQHPLWDVSIFSAPNGDLSLYVLDFLGGGTHGKDETPLIPIGEWFQVEVFLRRAADATGAFALYQNRQRILQLSGVITDDTDWGQWYVGNLADKLMPADSTIYVDDVAIRETP
jgi:hypothetical protein